MELLPDKVPKPLPLEWGYTYLDSGPVIELPPPLPKREGAQTRVNQFMWSVRQEPQIVTAPTFNILWNQAMLCLARYDGNMERNRRFDERFMPWLEAGMPVAIHYRPLFSLERAYE